MTSLRSRWASSIAVALLCGAAIVIVQPRLASAVAKAKRDDITAIPPPDQLRIMSFGYRAMGADLLWAKLLVEQGLHWEEKRAFPEIPSYVDGIIALDPDHPLLYQFVDTLLLFTPKGGTEADARLARRYLEEGAKAHPTSPDIWLQYGQFLAYLAPSFLKDKAEREQWKKEGALAIAQAIELGADPDRSLSASSLLNSHGERAAAIKQLQRAYALTDNPATRQGIADKLARLQSTVEAEATMSIVEDEWRTNYSILSRGGALLLGPHRSPAACAGLAASTSKECPRDWLEATTEGR